MGYHLIQGTRKKSTDFTRRQALPWQEYPDGLYHDQSNYYITDMKIQYGDEKLNFYLNKWDKHWGPGINSLTLSNKMPKFFHFGFQWKITNHIDFDYFHGRLNSNMPDSNYTDLYTPRTYEIVRNIAGHRIEWRPINDLIVSASEIVIYANRSIETLYCIPFLSFFSLQQNIGEIDNVMLSGDIQYFLNNNIRLYGALIIDEWSPPYTFDKDNRNWFGWQAGLELNDILISDSKFHLEYTWTDHRTYRHKYNMNDYYSYGVPIGFWAGPHAEELYMDYSLQWNNNNIKFIYSNSARGTLTDNMLDDQYARPNNNPIYDRFSGGKENKDFFEISINRKITSSLSLQLNYIYTNWKNAGNIYDPINSKLIFSKNIDLIKHSLGINIYYQL